jgi:hypothetical protein
VLKYIVLSGEFVVSKLGDSGGVIRMAGRARPRSTHTVLLDRNLLAAAISDIGHAFLEKSSAVQSETVH